MVGSSSGTVFGSYRRYHLFTAIKYLTYLLLGINVYLFLQEELLTLAHMRGEVTAGQLVRVFSATIDTGAWVILLLLFELETSVLDDSRIHGPVRWALHGIRGLCYVIICYAFIGYGAELVSLYQVVPFTGLDPCTLAGGQWSIMLNLDDFAALDASNCAALGAEVYQLEGARVLASADSLRTAQWLAWTDVINAGIWILVVIVLEVEVRLQLRGRLSGQVLRINKYLKLVLYALLFLAAAYWGVAGDLLDFWDAALWLFAFIFIELNVFEWQYESAREGTAA